MSVPVTLARCELRRSKAISDEMVEATIIGDDDLDDEDELVDGQAA